jgi:nitroreductase
MLTVEEAIKRRRSIRKFKPDSLPEDAINQLLEAARLAPSGSNRQPWRFLVVTDAEERRQLREICRGQAFIEEAPLVFVCCADLTAYSQASRRAREQEFVDFGVVETLSGRGADPEYRERTLQQPDMDRDTAIRSAMANVYIAIEHMVLMATALDLGTCWVGASGEAGEINQLFDFPDHIVPVALLPVGYAATVPTQRPRLALDEILLTPSARGTD